MIPGELYIQKGIIRFNINRKYITVVVMNHGDRPIQVGSHFHFYEINTALEFDRTITLGFRLNIPSGTAIRFEPRQSRIVELVQYAGKCRIFGFCKIIMGEVK